MQLWFQALSRLLIPQILSLDGFRFFLLLHAYFQPRVRNTTLKRPQKILLIKEYRFIVTKEHPVAQNNEALTYSICSSVVATSSSQR